jgi:hypothetical protein
MRHMVHEMAERTDVGALGGQEGIPHVHQGCRGWLSRCLGCLLALAGD